jgi:hypothetical protein
MPELTQGESLVRNRDIDEIDALIAERDKLKKEVERLERHPYGQMINERDVANAKLKEEVERLKNSDSFYLDEVAENKRLVERVSELEGALHFFRSVIQSGEGWTDHCEKTYRAALEKIKFRNHPGTTNHELAKEALSRTSEEA